MVCPNGLCYHRAMTDWLSDAALQAGMRAACAAARRWLGATAPNPPVGAAALDAHGGIIAVAAHQRAGEGHAEALLLRQLQARGQIAAVHTLCVTLEPCNHHGRTPPCTEAILAAGIRRVAIGVRDPNPAVAGGGAARLQAAGVAVRQGVEAELCAQLLYAFAHSVTVGKPWLTVKRALDAQGGMIPPPEQKTFTSPAALKLAHRLRKRADAILTGSGTILADNPCFTVRHVPDHPGKQRILAILDRRRRVPADYLAAAQARGFVPVLYDAPEAALTDLAARGVRDVLAEAGPQLSASLLKSPFWTQDIVIQAGGDERITVRYHDGMKGTAGWQLEAMLPEESYDDERR